MVPSGEILLNGRDLMQLSEAEMCKVRGDQITMIFQDPMTALNPVLTVGKQISEVIALHNRISKAEARKRGEEMLEMVGIPAARYDEYPGQFFRRDEAAGRDCHRSGLYPRSAAGG